MRRRPLSLLCILLLGNVLAQQPFDPDQALQSLAGEKKNIGIAAAVSVDGELQWAGAAGERCMEQGAPFSASTPTRIASIAKSFTAVAVMQLVESGQVALEAPIETYLPDLPENKKQLTVAQLLGHTSGLTQYRDEAEIENTIHYRSLQEAMEVFIDRPLLFPPGTQYFYTTYGFVVLGRILETVSGMPYAAYMKRFIFDPAGMTATYAENLDQVQPDASCLYHHNGRRAKAGKQNDLSNRTPGGGFRSTVEDVLKFGHAVLDGTLLKPETLELMIRPQPVAYEGNKYGLGWYLYGPPPNEHLVIGHSGGQTGCTSQLMLVPKTKTAVVVLSNTSGNYPEIAGFASQLIGFSEGERE
ncbi:serine hydrolase domain-containing protein [Robiginitalea sediminis]|uniref:serine hydrolase domain-containing protein n=1 Tax=Robiginitalea sediminis TaxID=1982593 RepID=UPI000B4AFF2F|nr:serine hydrolase domain-containing protein [Robiginitalea sediminis]